MVVSVAPINEKRKELGTVYSSELFWEFGSTSAFVRPLFICLYTRLLGLICPSVLCSVICFCMLLLYVIFVCTFVCSCFCNFVAVCLCV